MQAFPVEGTHDGQIVWKFEPRHKPMRMANAGTETVLMVTSQLLLILSCQPLSATGDMRDSDPAHNNQTTINNAFVDFQYTQTRPRFHSTVQPYSVFRNYWNTPIHLEWINIKT